MENGWARVYGRGKGTPGGVRQEEARECLRDREVSAMLQKKGVWASSNPERMLQLRAERRRDKREDKDADAEEEDAKPPSLLNVNEATREELALLPGIDEALAAKIIKCRPFKDKQELKDKVAGIGEKTMAKFEGLIALGPVRVNVNTATAKDLELVPGIGPTLAERIVQTRDGLRGKRFESIKELKMVKGLKDKTLEQIREYLTLGESPAEE